MSVQENIQIALSENLFLLRLNGFLQEAMLKNLLTSLGKRICTERSTGLILDCQHSKIIPLTCQKWILEEWLPQLRRQHGCNYRIAIIAPTDYFGRYSIDSMEAQLKQKSFGIHSYVASSEAEAREWIINFKA